LVRIVPSKCVVQKCKRFPFQVKRRKNASAAGAPPRTPLGELCSSDPLAGFWGWETGEGREGTMGRGEQGTKGKGSEGKDPQQKRQIRHCTQGAMAPKFELGEILYSAPTPKVHRPMYRPTRSDVIVLTNKHTNRRRWKHPTLFSTQWRWVKSVGVEYCGVCAW